MSDHYIDQHETKFYGEHAAKTILTHAVGVTPEFDAALKFVSRELAHATSAVAEAVSHAEELNDDLRKGTRSKGSAFERGHDVIMRFSSHLDSHPDGAVDRKDFFPADGTPKAECRTPARMLTALGRISRKLHARGTPVHDAAKWAHEIDAARSALEPSIAHATSAKTERGAMTPEVVAARTAWLTVYGAAKLAVEASLRLAGKLDRMSLIFHDLAVPSATTITEAPPTPPAPAN